MSPGRADGGSRGIWLTASGGPFLYTRRPIFFNHGRTGLEPPHVENGAADYIDSATLMNKGFEVIEACRLFNLPPSSGSDGSSAVDDPFHGGVCGWQHTAQFSVTDMRLPILYALTYPERIESDMRFPVMDLRHLEFCPRIWKNSLVCVWLMKPPRREVRKPLLLMPPMKLR